MSAGSWLASVALLLQPRALAREDGQEVGRASGPGLVGFQLAFLCSLSSFLLSSGLATTFWWMAGPGSAGAGSAACRDQPGLLDGREARPLSREDFAASDPCYHAALEADRRHPMQAITGKLAHQLPDMYGKVREKTIWSFWHDPEGCPTRSRCRLPDHIQLCTRSVDWNKGSFDYRIVLPDEVTSYVSMMELPLHWHLLRPVQQKETLMNALLARYGGVALDISTILLEPLDSEWDEMVQKRATFKGFAYRVNGQNWDTPEVVATWYLMSRREGIFSSAALNQWSGWCGAYLHPGSPVGDPIVTSALSSVVTLPSCREDASLPDGIAAACPEAAQPAAAEADSSVHLLNDRVVLLEDPRDGPRLPFAAADDAGMGTWSITSDATIPGPPSGCASMRECWGIVVRRHRERRLKFVKLFRCGGRLWQLRRHDLLSQTDTYFYNLLLMAGLNEANLRGTFRDALFGEAPV